MLCFHNIREIIYKKYIAFFHILNVYLPMHISHKWYYKIGVIIIYDINGII